jgi:hypothetical protein
MLPNATDLSPEIRQGILNQVKSQLGFEEYNRLVNTLGEDGVIDLVLTQMYSKNTSTPISRTKNEQAHNSKGRSLVFYIALLVAMIAGAYYPDGKILGTIYDKILPITAIVIGVGVLLIINLQFVSR